MNITGVAKNVAQKSLKAVNRAGEGTRKVVHTCVGKITKKSDDFVKTSDKVCKDTGIGAAVIAAAGGAIAAAVKGIADKVKEVKEK